MYTEITLEIKREMGFNQKELRVMLRVGYPTRSHIVERFLEG